MDVLIKDFREKATVSDRGQRHSGEGGVGGGDDDADGEKYRFGDWRRHRSKDPAREGRVFFQNFRTKEVSWTDPSKFTPAVLAKHEDKMAELRASLDEVGRGIQAKVHQIAEEQQQPDEATVRD